MSFGMVAASYLSVIDPGEPIYSDLVLTHSPLLYWRLGESSGTTVTDSSGNGRDGTYINGPTLGETSLLADGAGSAVYFDNSQQERAQVGSAPWMNTASITITCVYMCVVNNPGLQMLASRYWDDTTDVSWFLYRQNNEFKFYYRGSGGQTVTISSGVIEQVGQTYFIAAYAGVSGAGIRVYSLGGLIGSASGAGYAVNSSSRLFVVAGCDSATQYMSAGTIQELSYFGSSLSTADLDTLASLATAPQPKWLNRTAGTAPRNGTSSHALTFPATTNGSLLVAVVSGPVTSTATTPGWTKRLAPVLGCEVAVLTHTATAGEAAVQFTHNGSDYPVNYVIYEFPAGTSWVDGAEEANGNLPDLTGLPGTPVWVFAAYSMTSLSPSNPTPDTTWGWRWVEDVDIMTIHNGTTNGVYTALGWTPRVTRTSISPGSEGYYGAVCTVVNNIESHTSVTFALSIP